MATTTTTTHEFQLYNNHNFADEIHRMAAQAAGQLWMQWIPRHAILAHV